jgi:hypothetical protein
MLRRETYNMWASTVASVRIGRIEVVLVSFNHGCEPFVDLRGIARQRFWICGE